MTAEPLPAGRVFGLGQVLTLACSNTAAQQLFCSYAELLEVLAFMLADIPLAADIPAAIERCRPGVLADHPELAGLKPPAPLAPDTEVLTWLDRQEQRHGRELLLHSAVT